MSGRQDPTWLQPTLAERSHAEQLATHGGQDGELTEEAFAQWLREHAQTLD